MRGCTATHSYVQPFIRVRPLTGTYGLSFVCTAVHSYVRPSHSYVRPLIRMYGLSFVCTASHSYVRPLIRTYGRGRAWTRRNARARRSAPGARRRRLPAACVGGG